MRTVLNITKDTMQKCLEAQDWIYKSFASTPSKKNVGQRDEPLDIFGLSRLTILAKKIGGGGSK